METDRPSNPEDGECRWAIEHLVGHFELSVLETIRQFMRCCEHSALGVQPDRIVQYLQKQNYVDGDIQSQVTTALKALTAKGNIEHTEHGYRIVHHTIAHHEAVSGQGTDNNGTTLTVQAQVHLRD